LPDATADLEAALEQSPNDLRVQLTVADWARRQAETARGKGRVEEADKQRERACQHYRKAIQLAPADERAYLGLGEIYWSQDEHKRAISVWQDGLKHARAISLALNGRLAEALLSQDRLDQAEESLNLLDRAVVEIGANIPRNARLPIEHSVRLLRGKWLLQNGRYQQAIPLLREVALGPKGSTSEVTRAAQALLLLGSAYAALNRSDQAATAYERASQLLPDIVRINLAAADAWTAAGRPAEAAKHYERALMLADTPQTRIALAAARYRQQIGLPPPERNWELFDAALAAAKQATAEPLAEAWQLRVLEVEYSITRGKEKGQVERAKRDAIEALRRAEAEFPKAPGLA
jgi:tetratricopeptide (TPR) repeat protein